jgi:WD40 repeat protein
MNGEQIVLLPGHLNGVRDFRFSPDGKTLVSHGADNMIRFWDWKQGRSLGSVTGRIIFSMTFSPDGSTFAASSLNDPKVKLWNVADLSEEAPVIGHQGSRVIYASFSPDGRSLVTAGDDRRVIFWNLATRQPALTLETANPGSIEFSSDGKALIQTQKIKGNKRQLEYFFSGEEEEGLGNR